MQRKLHIETAPAPVLRPAHTLPLIGVWVERDGKTFRNWSTANIPGDHAELFRIARNWALACVRSGDTSASVRTFEVDGAERLHEILDWRDLPENAHLNEEAYA